MLLPAFLFIYATCSLNVNILSIKTPSTFTQLEGYSIGYVSAPSDAQSNSHLPASAKGPNLNNNV